MRIKATLVAALAVFSSFAAAQFDFGGGSTGPSEPWKEFKLSNSKIKLDFRNANVDSVIALYSRASGINIVKDPSLTGPITVTSAGPIPLNEAFQILNAVLSMKGFDMRKEGNLLTIRGRGGRGGGRDGGNNNASSPFGGMNPDQLREMFQGGRGGGSNLKVYTIQYANATQVARVVNDVFAGVQDPFQQMMQSFMGGGLGGGFTMGGRPGGNNQGGRNNQSRFSFGGRGGPAGG